MKDIRERALEAQQRADAATAGPYLTDESDPAFVYVLHEVRDRRGKPQMVNRWSLSVQGHDCPKEERAAVAQLLVTARDDVLDFARYIERATSPEMRERLLKIMGDTWPCGGMADWRHCKHCAPRNQAAADAVLALLQDAPALTGEPAAAPASEEKR